MTVPPVTAPPVPGCLVMTLEPSACDLGDREAGVAEVGELGEERVVAAGRLGAALEDVAGDGGAGEGVVVGRRPAEVRGRRADDERGVGDPAGDDDVGAGVETGDDPPGAEVGVGGQRRAEAELVGASAGGRRLRRGRRRRRRRAAAASSRTRLGEAGRVEPAGVGDDLDAAVDGEPEDSSIWRRNVLA